MNAPASYWQNYPAPYYKDWYHEPVPGWGARPVMAGPEMVGVGGFGAVPAPPAEYANVPEVVALWAEAKQKYPTNEGMQAAYIMTQGPGMARTWDQWIAEKRATVSTASMFGGGADMGWLWWVGGAVLIGGGLALAFNKGWIGSK